MMNNDTETSSSSPTVTTESKESNEAMTNAGEEEQSNDQSLVPAEDENNNNNDDQFIRITAAHQILTEAQTYDEQKNYAAALHLYRICVDLLLEELMFTEGTDQSRVYLREKCTAIMDHVDVLKGQLEPIEDINEPEKIEAPAPPPSDELSSLHLS